jgi:hypothetical protein
MTLEFKQGKETNKETLLGRLEDQGIMLKIQGGCVSWLVNLLGICWSGSLCRGHVAPIMQHIVISNGSGGINASDKYTACKHAAAKSEFYFLQSIQQTQHKTAKQHRDKIREIVMDFFSATSDKMINTVKKELFDDADGAPILVVGRDHPVVQEMMALPAPVKNGITCMRPSPARSRAANSHRATCTHARLPVHAAR